jgi:hypothetical protein
LRRRLKNASADLTPLVDAAGGLLVLDDFLPPLAAAGVASALQSLPEIAWAATAAADDAAQNNIDHFFHSTKGQNVTPKQAGEAAAAQAEAAAAAAQGARRSNSSSGSGGSGGDGALLDPPAAAAAAAEAAVRALQPIFRVFSLLVPGALHTFSAARYAPGHRIAPHDDRAYTRVRLLGSGGGGDQQQQQGVDDAATASGSQGGGGGGEVIECSRTLAIVYYASRVWRPEWGGALIDLEAGGSAPQQQQQQPAETAAACAAARRAAARAGVEVPAGSRVVLPKFNRLVAFRVPRYHQVTPVVAPADGGAGDGPRSRPLRFSVFGWFLEPGRLYPLYTGKEEEEDEEEEEEEEEEEGAGRAAPGRAGAAGRGARRREGGGVGAAAASAGRGAAGPRLPRASVATTATDDSGGEGWLQQTSN